MIRGRFLAVEQNLLGAQKSNMHAALQRRTDIDDYGAEKHYPGGIEIVG